MLCYNKDTKGEENKTKPHLNKLNYWVATYRKKGITTMTNSKTVRFTLDFVAKTITGTKASFDKAGTGDGDEYLELVTKLAAHPDFTLVVKKNKPTSTKNTYHGLNFSFMEEYISIQTNAADLMRRYEAAKKMAKDRGTKVYPFTKMWFLKEFEGFDIEKAKENINAYRMAEINAVPTSETTPEDTVNDEDTKSAA